MLVGGTGQGRMTGQLQVNVRSFGNSSLYGGGFSELEVLVGELLYNGVSYFGVSTGVPSFGEAAGSSQEGSTARTHHVEERLYVQF